MDALPWILMLVLSAWGLNERRRVLARIAALESGRPTTEAARRPVAPPRAAAAATATTRASRTARPARRLRIPWSRINLPAVLGVGISLLGFSFLLKLAIDQGWLRVPIEARHVAVALAGLAMGVLGWRLRRGPAPYSRTLIGGGGATICLTAFSAVVVFELLPAAVGFLGVLLAVAALGAMASTLRSPTLAAVGLLGGLTAPLSFVHADPALGAVLVYFGVFGAVTFALALRHAWRLLDLFAFAGSFGGAVLWTLYDRYRGVGPDGPVDLAIAFLGVVWLAVALAAPSRRGRLAGFADRLLLLGTPSATLGLFALFHRASEPLAWRSFAIGALCLTCGLLLRRTRFVDATRASLLLSSAVAFLALSVPLGLEGDWITLAWATGAALQIRAATRHGRIGFAAAGTGILVLALLVHAVELHVSWPSWPLSEDRWHGGGTTLVGLWLTAASLLSARWIATGKDRSEAARVLRWVPFALGLAAWFLTGFDRIDSLADGYGLLGAQLVLLAVSSVACAYGLGRMGRVAAACYAPLLVAYLAIAATVTGHPLVGLGGWGWPVALGALALVGRRLEGGARRLASWTLHVTIPAVALWEIHHRLDAAFDGVWATASGLTLLAAWIAYACRRFGDTPAFRSAVAPTMLVALALWAAWAQFGDGSAPPLPFVPLLNPLDAATAAALFALLALLATLPPVSSLAGRARIVRDALPLPFVCGVLAAVTMSVLRSVHHFADVPFDALALWRSMTAQTALTVTWAIVGLVAMTTGTARARRALWMFGAAVMGVVVVKLFAVDLDGVGTGARIVSFLGVGALLLAVGYVSPAPPRSGSVVTGRDDASR